MKGLEEEMEDKEFSKKLTKFHDSVMDKLDSNLMILYSEYHNSLIISINKLIDFLMEFKFTYWSDYVTSIFPLLMLNLVFGLLLLGYGEELTVGIFLFHLELLFSLHLIVKLIECHKSMKKTKNAINEIKKMFSDREEIIDKAIK